MAKIDTPRRLLIVRLTALGDVIHGLPVLCALREAFPSTFLAWMVEGRASDILQGHPALDQLVRVPRRWLKSPREVWKVRNQLRQLRFDTTLDLQCLTKSSVAAWLSGAPCRIGKAGSDGRELSKWFNNRLVPAAGDHVIDHYLEMLLPLGIESPAVRFDLPEPNDAATLADGFLGEHKISSGGYALLNPGAGWPSKLWPAERYAQVAQHVFHKHRLPSVVVWAGDQERQLAQTIVFHSQDTALLAPPTSITELTALARRARLFVGSDTGPMHLAVAVGTPTISLHGPSRAEWCGAYGPNNIRLQVQDDTGRARHKQSTDDSAMRAISTELVQQACEQLLSAPIS